MRIQLSISRNLMLLSLLSALCGCAATNAAVKSDKVATQTAAHVIRDIRVAGEGDNAQVVISADHPLAYTYYRSVNPLKGVIDLAQVEPGSFVSPMEINSGNIKRITATRVGEGEGAMTRVEVYLTRDVEMTVATDTTDKGTMRLSFVPPPAPVAVPAAVVAETVAPQPVQPVQEASPPKPAEAAPAPAEQKSPSAITAITPRKDSLEIQTTGDVADFKTFRLAKPDRLVLDVFGVKAAMAEKVVPVNSMGIGTVRVGAYPDKVRLVLDAAGDSLPALTVERTAAGLAVVPSSAPVATVRPAPAAVSAKPGDVEPPALVSGAAPRVEAKPLAPTGVAEIESIDFKVVDGISRIALPPTVPATSKSLPSPPMA